MKKSERKAFLTFYGEYVCALIRVEELGHATYNNNDLKEFEHAAMLWETRLEALELVAKAVSVDLWLDCQDVYNGIIDKWRKIKAETLEGQEN